MRSATAQRSLAAFGGALKTVRERQGLSQADLSEASGLHRTSISAIERGRQEPTFLTLMKLRRGLGSLADVFALAEGHGGEA
jgi:transcriptional regulator with XRE-family HTH domain